MKRGDRAGGLSGIGAAAGAAGEYLIVTIVLMLAAAWLLGMRLWGLAGLTLVVVQLLVVAFLFAHSSALGVHGKHRAVLFTIVAVVAVTVAATWWPRRRSTIDI